MKGESKMILLTFLCATEPYDFATPSKQTPSDVGLGHAPRKAPKYCVPPNTPSEGSLSEEGNSSDGQRLSPSPLDFDNENDEEGMWERQDAFMLDEDGYNVLEPGYKPHSSRGHQ